MEGIRKAGSSAAPMSASAAGYGYSAAALAHNEELRGEYLRLTLHSELWLYEKRRLTPAECRMKQALWEVFSALSHAQLQKAMTVVDRTWVSFLLELEKYIRERPRDFAGGVFFDSDNMAVVTSAERSAHGRRRSLPGRHSKIRKDERGEYTARHLMYRSWQHIRQLYPALSDCQTAYIEASEELRRQVRVADSTDRCDTLLVEPSLVANRARLWTLLDNVSLHGFATAIPPNSSWRDVGAETQWFAAVNVYSMGAFIANKLELSLWREFRTRAEGTGLLSRVKSSVPLTPTAALPPAAAAMLVTDEKAVVAAGSSGGGVAAPAAAPAVAGSTHMISSSSSVSSSTVAASSVNGNVGDASFVGPSSVPGSPVLSAHTAAPVAVKAVPVFSFPSASRLVGDAGVVASSSPPATPLGVAQPHGWQQIFMGCGLVAKQHLADYWNSLSQSERLKIICGADGPAAITAQGTVAITSSVSALLHSGGGDHDADTGSTNLKGSRSGAKRLGGVRRTNTTGAHDLLEYAGGSSSGGGTALNFEAAAPDAVHGTSSHVDADRVGPLPRFAATSVGSAGGREAGEGGGAGMAAAASVERADVAQLPLEAAPHHEFDAAARSARRPNSTRSASSAATSPAMLTASRTLRGRPVGGALCAGPHTVVAAAGVEAPDADSFHSAQGDTDMARAHDGGAGVAAASTRTLPSAATEDSGTDHSWRSAVGGTSSMRSSGEGGGALGAPADDTVPLLADERSGGRDAYRPVTRVGGEGGATGRLGRSGASYAGWESVGGASISSGGFSETQAGDAETLVSCEEVGGDLEPPTLQQFMRIWPWKLRNMDGVSVVSDLCLSRLERVGTNDDDLARKIAHRLQSRWAETNAMDLILAEEEGRTKKKARAPPPHSGLVLYPASQSMSAPPMSAARSTIHSSNASAGARSSSMQAASSSHADAASGSARAMLPPSARRVPGSDAVLHSDAASAPEARALKSRSQSMSSSSTPPTASHTSSAASVALAAGAHDDGIRSDEVRAPGVVAHASSSAVSSTLAAAADAPAPVPAPPPAPATVGGSDDEEWQDSVSRKHRRAPHSAPATALNASTATPAPLPTPQLPGSPGVSAAAGHARGTPAPALGGGGSTGDMSPPRASTSHANNSGSSSGSRSSSAAAVGATSTHGAARRRSVSSDVAPVRSPAPAPLGATQSLPALQPAATATAAVPGTANAAALPRSSSVGAGTSVPAPTGVAVMGGKAVSSAAVWSSFTQKTRDTAAKRSPAGEPTSPARSTGGATSTDAKAQGVSGAVSSPVSPARAVAGGSGKKAKARTAGGEPAGMSTSVAHVSGATTARNSSSKSQTGGGGGGGGGGSGSCSVAGGSGKSGTAAASDSLSVASAPAASGGRRRARTVQPNAPGSSNPVPTNVGAVGYSGGVSASAVGSGAPVSALAKTVAAPSGSGVALSASTNAAHTKSVSASALAGAHGHATAGGGRLSRSSSFGSGARTDAPPQPQLLPLASNSNTAAADAHTMFVVPPAPLGAASGPLYYMSGGAPSSVPAPNRTPHVSPRPMPSVDPRACYPLALPPDMASSAGSVMVSVSSGGGGCAPLISSSMTGSPPPAQVSPLSTTTNAAAAAAAAAAAVGMGMPPSSAMQQFGARTAQPPLPMLMYSAPPPPHGGYMAHTPAGMVYMHAPPPRMHHHAHPVLVAGAMPPLPPTQMPQAVSAPGAGAGSPLDAAAGGAGSAAAHPRSARGSFASSDVLTAGGGAGGAAHAHSPSPSPPPPTQAGSEHLAPPASPHLDAHPRVHGPSSSSRRESMRSVGGSGGGGGETQPGFSVQNSGGGGMHGAPHPGSHMHMMDQRGRASSFASIGGGGAGGGAGGGGGGGGHFIPMQMYPPMPPMQMHFAGAPHAQPFMHAAPPPTQHAQAQHAQVQHAQAVHAQAAAQAQHHMAAQAAAAAGGGGAAAAPTTAPASARGARGGAAGRGGASGAGSGAASGGAADGALPPSTPHTPSPLTPGGGGGGGGGGGAHPGSGMPPPGWPPLAAGMLGGGQPGGVEYSMLPAMFSAMAASGMLPQMLMLPPPMLPHHEQVDWFAISPDTDAPLWLEYQLHAELLKFQQWCTAHAHHRRLPELRVVWDIAKLAVECVPAASVHIFGSAMTGLAIPQSDVDVLVRGTCNARTFQALAAALRSQPWVRQLHAISAAQVPVIKLTADIPSVEPHVLHAALLRAALMPARADASAAVVASGGGSGSGGATGTDALLSTRGRRRSSLEAEAAQAQMHASHAGAGSARRRAGGGGGGSAPAPATADAGPAAAGTPSKQRAAGGSGGGSGGSGGGGALSVSSRDGIAVAVQLFDAMTRSPLSHSGASPAPSSSPSPPPVSRRERVRRGSISGSIGRLMLDDAPDRVTHAADAAQPSAPHAHALPAPFATRAAPPPPPSSTDGGAPGGVCSTGTDEALPRAAPAGFKVSLAGATLSAFTPEAAPGACAAPTPSVITSTDAPSAVVAPSGGDAARAAPQTRATGGKGSSTNGGVVAAPPGTAAAGSAGPAHAVPPSGSSSSSISGSSVGDVASSLGSALHRFAGRGWFDAATPVRIDLTFDSAAHRGLDTTVYTRSHIAQCPIVAPLVLVLKQLLQAHSLNDAYSGGISSYGLLLLTEGFLAHVLPDIPQILYAYRFQLHGDVRLPEAPLQPNGAGAGFADVAAPYAVLPRDLCGGLQDVVQAPAVTPFPRLPPIIPPHTTIRAVRRPGSPARAVGEETAQPAAAATPAASPAQPPTSPFVPYPAAASGSGSTGTTPAASALALAPTASTPAPAPGTPVAVQNPYMPLQEGGGAPPSLALPTPAGGAPHAGLQPALTPASQPALQVAGVIPVGLRVATAAPEACSGASPSATPAQPSPPASATGSSSAPSPVPASVQARAGLGGRLGVEVDGGEPISRTAPPPLLGKLFLRLLRYYGEEFVPSTTAMTCTGAVPLARQHAQGSLSVADPLNVVDPFDAATNVGRNCFRFFQVQQVLREARRTLMAYAASHAPSPPLRMHVGLSPTDMLEALRAAGEPPSPRIPTQREAEFPLLSVILASLRDL